MISVTVHEFAHGFTAYKLGDPTAKYSGRLSLNPLRHIDPFGTLILPIMLFIMTAGNFVFAWARPVPVNPAYMSNQRKGMMLVGASGPLANFIFAFILSLILKSGLISGNLAVVLFELAKINVLLGVFNLIPIPPMDGSRILIGLLPNGLAWQYARIEPFGFILVILFLSLGLFDRFVTPVVKQILMFLFK